LDKTKKKGKKGERSPKSWGMRKGGGEVKGGVREGGVAWRVSVRGRGERRKRGGWGEPAGETYQTGRGDVSSAGPGNPKSKGVGLGKRGAYFKRVIKHTRLRRNEVAGVGVTTVGGSFSEEKRAKVGRGKTNPGRRIFKNAPGNPERNWSLSKSVRRWLTSLWVLREALYGKKRQGLKV